MKKIFIIDDQGCLIDRYNYFIRKGDMVLPFRYDMFSISALDQQKPDIILLSLMHSVNKGIRLCKEMKSFAVWIPVITIVDPNLLAELDFKAGFDEFVLSSCDNVELDSRISMLMSKSNNIKQGDIIRVEGLEMNLATYSVTIDGMSIDMTFKEFELLKFLASHQGRAYTREVLLNQVWSIEYYGGVRTVDVHIRRLRFKIGKYEHLIQTIRNVGYKFGKN